MFIGHYAVGFGAKRAAPGVSLGTLLCAGLCMDIVWNVLVLANIEHFRIIPGFTRVNPFDLYDYPYSHSLAGSLILSIAIGLVYLAIKRNFKNALVVAFCVLSHWILDLLVHVPDLPLAPGSGVLLGLGLWNSYPLSMALEGAIYIAGLYHYVKATTPKDKAGVYGFWLLVLLLPIMWVLSMLSVPPDEPKKLALGVVFIGLTLLWAQWADNHRTIRSEQPHSS